MLKELLINEKHDLKDRRRQLIKELYQLDQAIEEVKGQHLGKEEKAVIQWYLSGKKEKNQGSLDLVKERLEKVTWILEKLGCSDRMIVSNHKKQRIKLILEKLKGTWRKGNMTQRIYTMIWSIAGWELGKWLLIRI